MAWNIYKHIENNLVLRDVSSFFVNFKDLQEIPLQLCSLHGCFSQFAGIPLTWIPDFRGIFFFLPSNVDDDFVYIIKNIQWECVALISSYADDTLGILRFT